MANEFRIKNGLIVAGSAYIQSATANQLLRVHADTNSSPSPRIELMRGAHDTWGTGDNYNDWRIENSNDLIFYSGTSSVSSGAAVERLKIYSADGALEINNAYKLPTAVTGTNNYVLTAQTDGSTAWASNSASDTTYTAGTGLDLSGTAFSVDVSDFMANGANNRILTATGTDAQNAEANLTFDGSALQLTGTLTVGVDDTGKDVKFFGATSGSYMLWDESTDDLILGGASKLGIGITAPVPLLHVYGNSDETTFSDAGAVGITIEQDGDGDAALSFLLTGIRRWLVGVDHSDADKFKISTGGTDLQTGTKLTIDSDGNVGIGTTSPAFPLEVNGWISAASGIVHMGDTNNTIQFDTDIQKFNTAGTTRLTIAADGTVTVAGAFLAATKSFVIPHPTKEGKTLEHGSLEGPEHGVYIRGKLEGDVIELPDYWIGLVDEDTLTVQLTPSGRFQRLYVDNISNSTVTIANEDDGPIDCFYFIQAERKDVDKLVVEY
jgi:hypothetical protein